MNISYMELSKAMSAITQLVGNALIVVGFAGLVIVGRAIYKAYAPQNWK